MEQRHVNLLVYFLIAYFGAWAAALSTDEAAKFIEPVWLFWSRGFCSSSVAGLLAIKMVISDSFTRPSNTEPKT